MWIKSSQCGCLACLKGCFGLRNDVSFASKVNHGVVVWPPEANLPGRIPVKLAPVASEPADPPFCKGKLLACWKRCAKVLVGFSLGAVLLTGCEPDDVPRFSPDGKKIALLLGLDQESYHQAPIPISVVTLADGRLRHYPLPESWSPGGFIWLEQRLLIFAGRPTNGPVEAGVRITSGAQEETRYWLLDTKTGRFSRRPASAPALDPGARSFRPNRNRLGAARGAAAERTIEYKITHRMNSRPALPSPQPRP